MRDSRLSVIFFVKYKDNLMYFTQDVYFSLGRNTHRERVWISHPRKVLHPESWLSPASLRSDRGSSRFSGSEDCSGLNMVWMANKDAFLVLSNQHGLSMVMVMVS